MRIYYDDDELEALGKDESDLKMYCLDGQSIEWTLCFKQGVNVTDRYVWANVSHFSYFVLGVPLFHATNVQALKDAVGQGYNFTVSLTVVNQANSTLAFDITLYADTALIDTEEVVIAASSSANFSFTCSTGALVYGTYIMKASLNGTESLFTGNSILVTIPGDVDGDKDVDIFDIVRIAAIYDVVEPDPAYDPNCDIDGDQDIDIFDIVAAASHYGEEWS